MKMPAAFLTAAMLLVSLPGLAEPQPDGDGDGVPDMNDVCQHTPPHATVDTQGCATDEDFDGIPDGLDACPHSDFGTAVDTDGCAANQRSGRTAPAAPPAPAAEPVAAAPVVTAAPAPVVTPAPVAPVRRAPAQINAPLPEQPNTVATPPPMSPLSPDAGELATRPATVKAKPAAAPKMPAPVTVPAPAPVAAPAPMAQPPAATDDDQRALLDEIDRREREREAAEAATLATPAAPASPVMAQQPAMVEQVLADRDPHLFSEVLFAPGKADFSEGDVRNLRDALPRLVELMQRSPRMRVTVVGHADAKTDGASAGKVAEARALAVHAWLIRNGLSPKRSSRSSQSAGSPVVMRGNSNRNRRVEILAYPD